MKRSVIKVAKNTLVVTLPKKWVERYNVSPRDQIDLQEHDNRLVVSTETAMDKSSHSIKLSGPYQHIRRQITMLFRQGADQIETSFEDTNTLQDVLKVLQSIMGFEIVSRTQRSVVLKDVANLDVSQFDNLMSRYFHVSTVYIKDLLSAIKSKNVEEIKSLRHLLDTQRRLYYTCTRLVCKFGYKITKHTEHLYLLIDSLESLHDHFERIGEVFIEENTVKVSKEVIELYEKQVEALELLRKLYYSFDPAIGIELMKIRKNMNKQGDTLLRNSSGHHTLLLHHLCAVTWSMHDCASAIYGVHANGKTNSTQNI